MKHRHLLLLSLTLAVACPIQSRATGLITIKTKSATLVFSTDAVNDAPANRLTETYFGPVAGAPTAYGKNDPLNIVYPTANSIFYDQPAVRITHWDGNTSSDLALESSNVQTQGNTQLTTLVLKDSAYPAWVTLYIRSYPDIDVFEEWASFWHTEPSLVTLYDLASGTITTNDYSGQDWGKEYIYYLRHYSSNGSWGVKQIDSTIGALITLFSAKSENLPFYYLTTNQGALTGAGNGIGFILADGKPANVYLEDQIRGTQYVGDNYGGPRMRILVTGSSKPRTVQSNQIVTTQHLVFSYSEGGFAGAEQNLKNWTLRNGCQATFASLLR